MRAKGRVFLVDDDDLITSMVARSLQREGYEIQSRNHPAGVLDEIRSFAPHVVLLDLKLPGTSGMQLLGQMAGAGIDSQVVMLTADDSAESAVKAMKSGAADYLTKPFDLEEVKVVVASVIEQRNLKQEVGYLRKISSEIQQRDFIGSSPGIRQLKESAGKLARAGVPSVLITGENGTGKEVLARHVHDLMHAGDTGQPAPFIGINCAALPEHLFESELFGHERGAFTDAKGEKKGVFELAAGGTVLLDEIGEMNMALQAKLLRVLEEWKLRRVGGSHDIPIEARVFATTNRDLAEAVRNGTFRIDLFYRLATFGLHVPPLRERREDVPFIADHFMRFFCRKYGRPGPTELSDEARELMLAHDWPGNVRELRNTVERFVVLESGPRVLVEHLPKEILHRQSPAPDHAHGRPPGNGHAAGVGGGGATEITLPDGGLSLEDLESTLIVQALARAGRNKAQAAKLLGMTYESFRYQVKKLGLD